MSLKQKTVKGIFWSFIEKWCNQIVSTSVFLILARILGPEAFGLTALAGVFLAFMMPFLNQGFAQAIVQREEIEQEHLDTAFCISCVTGLVLIVLTITFADLVANFFKEPRLAPIICWLSINFLFIALQSVPVAVLRRQLLFKALAIRSSVAVIVSGIVGLLMAFNGFGVWSLVGQQLTNGFVGVITLWSASKWRPTWKISYSHFKELFSFGSSVMGMYILRFFNRRSDDFLIGYFLGSTALGYYTVAYRLLLVMVNMLTTTTTQVALPTFAKLQNKPEKLKRAFYTATHLTSFVAFPTFIGVMVITPELVPILFGEEWLKSIPVMQVLSLVGILHSVSFFNGTIMMAMGKPHWRLKVNLLNAVVNIIGFFIAVRWGILAVAIAFVVSGYLLSPIYIWIIYKLIKIDISVYLKQYAAPLLASLIMFVALIITKLLLKDLDTNLLVLGIYGIVSISVYILSVIAIAPDLFKQVLELVILAKKKVASDEKLS